MDIVRRAKSATSHGPLRAPRTHTISQHTTSSHKIPTSTPPQHTSIESFDTYIRRTQITERSSSRFAWGTWCLWIAFAVFVGSAIWAGYAFYHKTNETFARISDDKERPSVLKALANITDAQSYRSLQGFDDGRMNILLLGRANTHKSGKDLTDTIMLASINTIDYKIGLFSVPRDLLVHTDQGYIKINALYQAGVRNDVGADYIINTMEDITAQKIHYYVVMDFEGFTKIIDTLDGINVDVPNHIKDEKYPGPGYSYETFEVFPGLQKFNGETALKYARTRHDHEGDFGRAKRQQQIMQAAKNKAFSLGTIVNPVRIAEIFNVLGEHLHTNISPNEIEPFIALFRKLDTQNITTVVVDAWQPESLLISTRSGNLSGLTPRTGNFKEVRERAELIFDLQKIAQRKKDILIEQPTVTLVNTTSDTMLSARISSLLQKIGFQHVTTFTDTKKNAPTPRTQTVIVDRTSGAKPFSLDELIKKVPAIKGDAEVDKTITSDFVIFLGDDILDIYTYTEITREELEQANKDEVINDNTY